MIPHLRTPRLLLRGWRPEDRGPFAEMCADREVMAHMVGPLTRDQSDAMADRIAEHFAVHGFGLWACELRDQTPFAGFVGLAIPKFEAWFTPAVEIGWRLERRWWGHGYASEGARAVLDHAFTVAGLAEVVSFTVPTNVRSWKVMERLGMTRDLGGDFDHPRVPEGHPHRRHVLYRLSREQWLRASRRPGSG